VIDWISEILNRLRGGRVDTGRWVVVDTETTGLDPAQDRLLSIGAVAIIDGRVSFGDSFEIDLEDTLPVERDAVLVHGIGQMRRAAGVPPLQAIEAWRAWARDSPAFAFHAEFDRRVMRTAAARAGLPRSTRRWLDVAELAESCIEVSGDRRNLDAWLAHFSIEHPARHDATGDALATAQLLQVLLQRIDGTNTPRFRDLQLRLARHRQRTAAWSG